MERTLPVMRTHADTYIDRLKEVGTPEEIGEAR